MHSAVSSSSKAQAPVFATFVASPGLPASDARAQTSDVAPTAGSAMAGAASTSEQQQQPATAQESCEQIYKSLLKSWAPTCRKLSDQCRTLSGTLTTAGVHSEDLATTMSQLAYTALVCPSEHNQRLANCVLLCADLHRELAKFLRATAKSLSAETSVRLDEKLLSQAGVKSLKFNMKKCHEEIRQARRTAHQADLSYKKHKQRNKTDAKLAKKMYEFNDSKQKLTATEQHWKDRAANEQQRRYLDCLLLFTKHSQRTEVGLRAVHEKCRGQMQGWQTLIDAAESLANGTTAHSDKTSPFGTQPKRRASVDDGEAAINRPAAIFETTQGNDSGVGTNSNDRETTTTEESFRTGRRDAGYRGKQQSQQHIQRSPRDAGVLQQRASRRDGERRLSRATASTAYQPTSTLRGLRPSRSSNAIFHSRAMRDEFGPEFDADAFTSDTSSQSDDFGEDDDDEGVSDDALIRNIPYAPDIHPPKVPERRGRSVTHLSGNQHQHAPHRGQSSDRHGGPTSPIVSPRAARQRQPALQQRKHSLQPTPTTGGDGASYRMRSPRRSDVAAVSSARDGYHDRPQRSDLPAVATLSRHGSMKTNNTRGSLVGGFQTLQPSSWTRERSSSHYSPTRKAFGSQLDISGYPQSSDDGNENDDNDIYHQRGRSPVKASSPVKSQPSLLASIQTSLQNQQRRQRRRSAQRDSNAGGGGGAGDWPAPPENRQPSTSRKSKRQRNVASSGAASKVTSTSYLAPPPPPPPPPPPAPPPPLPLQHQSSKMTSFGKTGF